MAPMRMSGGAGPFDKILIANRGEIAVRIARTCRAMNIATVAVYSDADAHALHVDICDEAWPIGPAPARESYLSIDRILAAAQASGAQAIHPGYGFLSENAAFAEACATAGLVFIGPPPSAIRAMGSKSAAKTIMGQAGVPLVPGYHGDDQSPERLSAAAAAIGFPVLIKASAGGGGKGMRRVDNAAGFGAALVSAKREAVSAFADDRMLVEKYLLRPRHIEVQVFADAHGNAVHLFERDCSVQRRHQKVVEEAPAPGLSPERRAEFGTAAVAAARAIGYVGAGTVEFIMDEGGDFYFMEMNTRLQVEHPVTEMITGQDLVAWQIQVASGLPLPLSQEDLSIRGHAFEARVYAEDADRDFMPAIGTITQLRAPPESAHVRIDTGIRAGDTISVHYDPMIAKLIVWDRDRVSALSRLSHALDAYAIAGTTTNLEFLSRIARHPAFAAGAVDTGFIEANRAELIPAAEPVSNRHLAVAALFVLLTVERDAARLAAGSRDPFSPWHDTSGWRLNSETHHTLIFVDGEREISVAAHYRPGGFVLDMPDGALEASARFREDGTMRVVLDGVHLDARVMREGERITIRAGGDVARLAVRDPRAFSAGSEEKTGNFIAPMPGIVLAVMVSAGDTVAEGDALLVMEAMKMEHTIRAYAAGIVAELYFRPGDQVEEGAILLRVAATA